MALYRPISTHWCECRELRVRPPSHGVQEGIKNWLNVFFSWWLHWNAGFLWVHWVCDLSIMTEIFRAGRERQEWGCGSRVVNRLWRYFHNSERHQAHVNPNKCLGLTFNCMLASLSKNNWNTRVFNDVRFIYFWVGQFISLLFYSVVGRLRDISTCGDTWEQQIFWSAETLVYSKTGASASSWTDLWLTAAPTRSPSFWLTLNLRSDVLLDSNVSKYRFPVRFCHKKACACPDNDVTDTVTVCCLFMEETLLYFLWATVINWIALHGGLI